jgi:two-component system chemotaxis response regulator CheB
LTYALICIGASWGGVAAVAHLLGHLSDDVGQPVAVVLHRAPSGSEPGLADVLQHASRRPVAEAFDKQAIERGHVYLAPADYHLLVEPGAFALSTGERVRFARPSIDVLFESAADAYREAAVGIILTGTNDDGASGLARIKAKGGVAVVQDPATSERRSMPDAALAATRADAVLPLDEIPAFLTGLCGEA